MSNFMINHKNFESDTIHGHQTFESEKILHTSHPQECVHLANENANKLCDEYEEREVQKGKDNVLKKTEYRDFLLKQISDKKKRDYSPTKFSSLAPFSEELLEQSEKNNMKLQKQREARQNLDDCIKMKDDFKLQTQRTELEEEQKRTEFWKKRDDDTVNTMEKVKQKTEMKENKKNEVALLWLEEKRKDINREKFIDSLMEKESIAILNKHQQELIEVQKLIRKKKELLEENEEKIEQWLKNIDLARKEQEQLKADIVEQETLETKLKLNSRVLRSSQNSDVVDRPRGLQERNGQCANEKFFGIN